MCNSTQLFEPSMMGSAARSDAENRQLDKELVAYLLAQQDYMTLHLELEAALKEGHLALARARRELSRWRCGSNPALPPMPRSPEVVFRLELSTASHATLA